jgi:hypothetical protein
MNSTDEEHWAKLIRGVRGNGAARAWHLYNTGQLENAFTNRHQSSTPEKAAASGSGILKGDGAAASGGN